MMSATKSYRAVLLGPYWSHVNAAWALRHHPNLHIMFYEEMKRDAMNECGKLNAFLGTGLSEDQLKKVSPCWTTPKDCNYQ